MNRSRLLLALVGWSALQAACSDAPAPGSGSEEPPPGLGLVADANLDGELDLVGRADDPSSGASAGSASREAYVLANLDDDDADRIPDAYSGVVDGDADVPDLTPLALRGLASLPDDAVGVIAVDAAAAPHLTVFRVLGDPLRASSYAAYEDPTRIVLAAQELRSGARFALDATDFPHAAADGWSGAVEITLSVSSKTGTIATSSVKLRVAPLIFQWNTAPTTTVYYTDLGTESVPLRKGLSKICQATTCKGIDLPMSATDQWTQDFFDMAYTSRPGPAGTAVGMKVLVRSAQEDRASGRYMRTKALAPDVAAFELFSKTPPPEDGVGYSMSSFGNWDVIPPYELNGVRYPVGRNIWGRGATSTDQPDPLFEAFVRAQGAQPAINVDTSWLVVGHVDEFFSWVKTSSPRGWVMLAGSPSLAKQMLVDLKAQGHGSAKLFDGLGDYDYPASLDDPDVNKEPDYIDAARTINAVLADADLMAESQLAQVKIDLATQIVRTETGLADSEIIAMPFLFKRVYGSALAYQPGTVNLLHADGRVAVPKPFGPSINGADPFETDLTSRLGALGLSVDFVDDWDLYHVNMGEVHCGTNVSRDIAVPWWEASR